MQSLIRSILEISSFTLGWTLKQEVLWVTLATALNIVLIAVLARMH